MPAEPDKMSLMRVLLAETRGSIAQAQAAIDHGQSLDLRAFEALMARLCSQALDLPPALRPQARAELASLQLPMERLFETLTRRAA